jgi:tryptophan-rich sensory protein
MPAALPLVPIAFAVAWTILLGLTGALVTDIGPWYRGLIKPSWQPPDWLFGPVWTSIFICAAVAFYLTWQHPEATTRTRTLLVTLWLVNALLNVLWSFLFFRLRRPDWSLLEIAPLWLSIVGMLLVASTAGRAGWLLAPYIAWVSFAAVLNATIVRLNGPFRG